MVEVFLSALINDDDAVEKYCTNYRTDVNVNVTPYLTHFPYECLSSGYFSLRFLFFSLKELAVFSYFLSSRIFELTLQKHTSYIVLFHHLASARKPIAWIWIMIH